MAEARERWRDEQGGLDPACLVFIDENLGQDQYGPIAGTLPAW